MSSNFLFILTKNQEFQIDQQRGIRSPVNSCRNETQYIISECFVFTLLY